MPEARPNPKATPKARPTTKPRTRFTPHAGIASIVLPGLGFVVILLIGVVGVGVVLRRGGASGEGEGDATDQAQ